MRKERQATRREAEDAADPGGAAQRANERQRRQLLESVLHLSRQDAEKARASWVRREFGPGINADGHEIPEEEEEAEEEEEEEKEEDA